ncbi:transcriptional repressor LexA [Pectinatus brassicae]|uniref:Repressor LexA n=1 Tax=Pectinatus brassicae TaxID=862415 RepID=A0A840UMF0_9FIRM|nr:transcriptional repressor LexA [Pectinatus brassicae]MBB5335858.1 repressor LexA [Pectinatus brassicae]
MTEFAERLRKYMMAAEISQTKLSRLTGINKSSICEYLSGSYEPKQQNVLKIAAALNIPPEYFWGMNLLDKAKKDVNEKVKKIPLIGSIAAGRPILAVQDFDEYIPCDSSLKADFCLRISGDSMINARIYDGDIVFIHEQSDVNDGEIAAVLVDDSATLKRVYKYGNMVQLRAENPKYKPMEFDRKTCSDIRILGKAVALLGNVI